MMTKVFIGNLAALGMLGVAACVGNIGDGSGGAAPASGGSTGGSSAGGPVAANGSGGSDAGFGQGVVSGQACTKGASFAPARLSLVSDDQYRNIVHDVFGVTFPATTNVTAASSNSGSYAYDEGAALQATTVQEYQRAADTVASLMPSMPPCTTGAVNATCMETYLRNTLPRAWRRPVTDAEIAGLMAIFNMPNVRSSARQIQLTMEAALIHPAFLFRSEIGGDAATGTGKVQLTAYELASALSFAVLNSVPDPELWAKAQDGSLTQPAVLAAQASRLIALPAVQANLMKKVSYYLDFEKLPVTEKDPKAYPSFTTLQPTLYQSSQMFLGSILWTGHFNDLFTTKTIYANQAMAAAYGLPPVSGAELQPVTPTGGMYGAGVLTQPALLAASNTSAAGDDVIHRGLWIYYNLLCAPALPPPPPNAASVAATLTGESTRQQAAYRDGMEPGVAGSGCGSGCHGRFDPFGLVTMSYDGIGRYRTTDPSTTPPGGPIDNTATVPAGVLLGTTTPTAVTSADDVAQLFIKGRQVSDCAADNLATYMLEHSPDVEGSCELQTVKDSFQASGSFALLFASILTSPAFATRDIE
jgi:Protein of unknown function (DUF1592)/Protein of unknown function (DUF1588)/Protein of unknown function (DUF1595)